MLISSWGIDEMIGWGNSAEWARYSGRRNTDVLWTIFVILLVLWLVGVVTSYTLGGFIHILLVMALVVMLIRIIQGRSPVS
jgi:hypothetical protein